MTFPAVLDLVGVAVFAGMVVIVGVRLAAILWGLQLPVFQLDSPAGKR